MTFVLDVLLEMNESNPIAVEITPPLELLDSFGKECAAAGLLDQNGCFNDPYQLVRFFVQPISKRSRKK